MARHGVSQSLPAGVMIGNGLGRDQGMPMAASPINSTPGKQGGTPRFADRQWGDAFLAFRHKLRAARAKVQADAEDYMAVYSVVESLVEYLKANCKEAKRKAKCERKRKTKRKFHSDLCVLHFLFPSLDEFPDETEVSYVRLREARNAHVHEGAVSRSLGRHAVRLSLALEEALMDLTKLRNRVDSWMVPEPVVAESWQTVSEVRVALLSGGYSALPFWWKRQWYFVRDVSVVSYLLDPKVEQGSREDRDGCLNCRLETIVEPCKGVVCRAVKKVKPQPADSKCPTLWLSKVPCDYIVEPSTCVKTVKLLFKGDYREGLPLLVVEDQKRHPSRLLGVLTPHDLLV